MPSESPPLRIFRNDDGHLQAEGDGDWAALAMFLVADLNGDVAALQRMLAALEAGDPGFSIGGNVHDVACTGDGVTFTDVEHDTSVTLPAAGVGRVLRAWADAMAPGCDRSP